MNTRALILTILVMLGVVVGGVALFQIFGPQPAQVNLTVVPSDSKLTVDGKAAKAGLLSLGAGSHTFVVSHSGFTTKTVALKFTAGQKTDQGIALDSSDPNATVSASDAQEGESIAGQRLDTESAIITANNPLIARLPYQGSDFSIDVGVSVKNPNDASAVALYITAATDLAKTHALNWIRAVGYDPATYEIIYQATAPAPQVESPDKNAPQGDSPKQGVGE